jgi:hypothetical protein
LNDLLTTKRTKHFISRTKNDSSELTMPTNPKQTNKLLIISKIEKAFSSLKHNFKYVIGITLASFCLICVVIATIIYFKHLREKKKRTTEEEINRKEQTRIQLLNN